MLTARAVIPLVLLLGSVMPDATSSPSRGEVPPGRVTSAPTMRAARAAHSATPLHDGRVLVAGGFTAGDDGAAGAELYEPRRRRFVPLPRMVTLRHSHTATTLPDGRVLITGGYGPGNAVIPSAELFDPVTNQFVPTGVMQAARAGHVAVLLANGKVLIAGGVGPNWSFLSSAEVYDPATGRFSTTGSMTVSRESHVGVLLPDHRVLMIGGHTGRRAQMQLYTSVEAYDAVRGTFTKIGDLQVRRHKHDAVLLRDGAVLVTGGADERDMDGVYDSTELFDPATGTSRLGRPLVRGRYKHNGSSVMLPDGSVLIAGGAAEAEIYDPTARTFTLVPGTAAMAGQFSAVAPLDAGRVLITGGYGNGSGPRNAAWVYQP